MQISTNNVAELKDLFTAGYKLVSYAYWDNDLNTATFILKK